ncbi:hypothetical protein FNV43_RR00282 [Rhamnella rubrinervis]|uniref:Tesmin/TSO1-like CXC domain-containing protein n=1 Tax=Rhamnella rubrinervis TaxID=2594499 RepID=A0A8K0HP92_9ROSA|nr:hypothetical protein FNV43_RR00282 [Rhamnella rubrinervis]
MFKRLLLLSRLSHLLELPAVTRLSDAIINQSAMLYCLSQPFDVTAVWIPANLQTLPLTVTSCPVGQSSSRPFGSSFDCPIIRFWGSTSNPKLLTWDTPERNQIGTPVAKFEDEFNKTLASARHKRGCNCKKASCLKKYCECYQMQGCENAFGRKAGSVWIGTEAEPEEDEEEASEKSLVDKPLQKIEIQHNEEQNLGPGHPMKPLQASRSLIPPPFSSKSKPPRSSFLHRGIFFWFVLWSDTRTAIKTSPKSKRISPKFNLGSLPGHLIGRELILRSIPSFPSLSTAQSHR